MTFSFQVGAVQARRGSSRAADGLRRPAGVAAEQRPVSTRGRGGGAGQGRQQGEEEHGPSKQTRHGETPCETVEGGVSLGPEERTDLVSLESKRGGATAYCSAATWRLAILPRTVAQSRETASHPAGHKETDCRARDVRLLAKTDGVWLWKRRPSSRRRRSRDGYPSPGPSVPPVNCSSRAAWPVSTSAW